MFEYSIEFLEQHQKYASGNTLHSDTFFLVANSSECQSLFKKISRETVFKCAIDHAGLPDTSIYWHFQYLVRIFFPATYMKLANLISQYHWFWLMTFTWIKREALETHSSSQVLLLPYTCKWFTGTVLSIFVVAFFVKILIIKFSLSLPPKSGDNRRWGLLFPVVCTATQTFDYAASCISTVT